MVEIMLADQLVIWDGTPRYEAAVGRRADYAIAERLGRFPAGEC